MEIHLFVRAGLSVSVILWVLSHSSMTTNTVFFKVGSSLMGIGTSHVGYSLMWHSMLRVTRPISFDHQEATSQMRKEFDRSWAEHRWFKGVSVWHLTRQLVSIGVEYWLICLTFLITTVATHWPRKSKGQRTVEAAAEAVTEDEHQ